MTGSAKVTFTGTTRPLNAGETAAAAILLRVINPDGSWGPSKNIAVINGEPETTSAVFSGLEAAPGYTAVCAALDADGNVVGDALTSEPFGVVEASMTFVPVGVIGQSA